MKDSHLTDAQLDRLVDGELTDHEYRQVLASLGDEPGGWRRCALAFIEAQALGRELGELAELAGPRENTRPAPAGSSPENPRWPLWLAMAGSFLLAFTLGILLSGGWPGVAPRVDRPARIAGTASEENRAGDFAAAAPAEPEPSPAINQRGPAFDEDERPHMPEGVMTFVFEGDGNEMRRVELPYYRYDDRQAAQIALEGPQLPPELVRALRRMGHDLRQRRQLLPVDLEDGSRVVFPMDEVEIVPVGGRGYQ
jgi:hypothetical protein